ncbi:MAG: hypothetical protein EBT75_00235 [Proteobacteria bacterium]|nr:hypothetical protein [Pseudomonadota bacterium]NBS49048.1 hypothetical protein [Verrucomicrobiota bacterium]
MTTTSRYIIVKQEQDMNVFDCEHPLCERLHKKWIQGGICHKPRAPRAEYVIVDTATDERVDGYDEAFDTKREATAALTRFLNLLKKGEQQ